MAIVAVVVARILLVSEWATAVVLADGALGSPRQFGLSHSGRSLWISLTMRFCADGMGSHSC